MIIFPILERIGHQWFRLINMADHLVDGPPNKRQKLADTGLSSDSAGECTVPFLFYALTVSVIISVVGAVSNAGMLYRCTCSPVARQTHVLDRASQFSGSASACRQYNGTIPCLSLLMLGVAAVMLSTCRAILNVVRQ